MKKTIWFLLLLCLMIAFTGCSKTKEDANFVPDSAPTALPESENQPNI